MNLGNVKGVFALGSNVYPVSNFCSFSLRRQEEAELKLIEEETAKRVEDAIKRKVDESLNTEEIKLEIRRRLEEGRKKLVNEVAAQLEKEKESALIESKQKEASYFCLIICFPHVLVFFAILAVTCLLPWITSFIFS